MFRTELTIAPATGQLPRTARVLTMGSCFADSIGARLAAHKVETRVNPFGTVFQPLALGRLLRAAAGEDVDWQQHLVQARGRWQSYDLHGSIGADSPVELLQYIQEVVRQTGEFLRGTDLVLLTLGTAWAYRLRETGELVSNCHKQPADLFVRELLTPDEIINALAETHAYLRRINPEVRFVLTVSPVRHLKDTLPLNSVSKSVLRLATHIVSDLLPGVAYFPAFELLTDDLRDYRFYAADMLHPSEAAEDYIWDKFARTYFDADFGRFRKEWAAVRQSLGHRPLHEGAPEHRQFLESTREKLEQLGLRNVEVADELRTVRARLAALPLPIQPVQVDEPEDDEERIDVGAAARGEAAEPTAASAVAEAARVERPARGEDRPPRLSPEEFRAQRAARPERGRRDGRGKGRAAQPTETEQFQAASFAEADEFAQQPFLTESTLIELTPVASATETTVSGPDEADTEAGPKKKRRSRGGAKRTARKHALRAAAETGLDESPLATSEAALEAAATEMITAAAAPAQTENPAAASEAREPRHNRRNDGGRGAGRVPLVAASTAPAADASADAFEEMTNSAGVAADLDQDVPVSSSRKSRNRKKKKGARPVVAETADAGQDATPVPTPRGAIEAVATPEALEAAQQRNRRDNRRPQNQPVAALPVGGATVAVVATPVVLVPAPSAAPANEFSQPVSATAAKSAKSSKRKSRTMAGGRMEKPAVDTPIIPVVDASMPRSQVAGGRLTGTSASLVEPTAPARAGKAASAPKPAAANAQKSSTPVTKAPAVSPTTTAGPKAPAAPLVVPAASAGPPPQGAAAKSVKKDGAASSKAPAVPKAPAKVAAAAAPAKTVAVVAEPTTKQGVAKEAPGAAEATPVAASRAAPTGKPAGAKPAKKVLASATPAVVAPAKPAAKPAAKLPATSASAAATAPKVAAVAKAAKPATAAAEKPKPTKKPAPKAAPAKAAAAKPGATKSKAPKKTAS